MEARQPVGRPQEGSGKIAADGWGHCGWCSQDRAARPGGYARLERAVGGKEGSAEGHGPGTQKEVLLAATSSAFLPTRPMSNAGSLVSVQGPRGYSVRDREGQRQAVSIREGESTDSRSAVSPVLCCQGPPSRQEAE